uniref:Uncharacterized protein n=1 Tax=Oryza punctata TaxID=4537 RepID=A0A0E0JNX2_ORYPU
MGVERAEGEEGGDRGAYRDSRGRRQPGSGR